MLINVLRDEAPTHVAVAFDRGEPTFRHEQWVEYKANRRETPADFRNQLSLIFEVLDALGIQRLSVPGYEADDIIATLATQAEQAGFDVLIVTGDRDVLQLVDERTTALMTRRGITEMTRFTPEEVAAKYGLTPAQYPDYAALRGDPSDNLPSIPGVGEKTAAKWVAEYGSLGQLVDRVDEVKGRAGDKLREHLSDVLRNRQLTELARDVPLDVGPAGSAPRHVGQGADPPALRHPPVPGPAGPPLLHAAERNRRGDRRGRPRRRGGRDVRRGDRAARAGGGGRLAGRARGGRGPDRRGGQRHLGPGHRDLDRAGPGHPRRRRRLPRPGRAHRGRRAGAGGLAGRPGPAQGDARRQGPDPRPGRPWPGAGRADHRHRARRLPRPARPALLRPGRPGPALPGQGAEARRRDRHRAARARPFRRGRRGRWRGAGRDRAGAAGPRHGRARRRARRRTWSGGGPPGCCTRWSCR